MDLVLLILPVQKSLKLTKKNPKFFWGDLSDILSAFARITRTGMIDEDTAIPLSGVVTRVEAGLNGSTVYSSFFGLVILDTQGSVTRESSCLN